MAAAPPPPTQSPNNAQQKQQQQQFQLQQQQQQQQAQQRPPSSSSQTPQKPILQPPLSPASQKLEAQRVTALLEINRVLLYEMTQLQAAGRFGPLFGQPQQPGQGSPGGSEGEKKEGGDVKDGGHAANGDAGKAKGPVQSREYIECVDPCSDILANFHIRHAPLAFVSSWHFLSSLLVLPLLPISSVPSSPFITLNPP